MYLGTAMFFIGFAMAIVGVFFWQKASDTAYDRLILDIHSAKAEMADTQRELGTASEIVDSFKGTFEIIKQRLDSLEKRPTTVNFEGPKKPVLVEIVDAPFRQPTSTRAKLKPLKSKSTNVTQ
jgi:hypothetical protein